MYLVQLLKKQNKMEADDNIAIVCCSCWFKFKFTVIMRLNGIQKTQMKINKMLALKVFRDKEVIICNQPVRNKNLF